MVCIPAPGGPLGSPSERPTPGGLAPARACDFGEATRQFVALCWSRAGDSWSRAADSSIQSGQPGFIADFTSLRFNLDPLII